MAKKLLGYEFLREHLDLSAFPCARSARISSVTKVLQRPDGLDVPAAVAPTTQAPLTHILFALKHEGINLQVLAQSLPQIAASDISEAFCNSPASKYIRIAAYLWEQFTGHELAGLPNAVGPYVDLFDPKKYLTGHPRRNTRRRVIFSFFRSAQINP